MNKNEEETVRASRPLIVLPILLVLASVFWMSVSLYKYYYSMSKEELFRRGVEIVGFIESQKRPDGTYPYPLQFQEECDVEYSVGPQSILYSMEISKGPHKWVYYKSLDLWSYNPDSYSD